MYVIKTKYNNYTLTSMNLSTDLFVRIPYCTITVLNALLVNAHSNETML